MKIGPKGAELFYANGRTDGETTMTNISVAVCNFLNAPKIVSKI
jgi:hypothetical protein